MQTQANPFITDFVLPTQSVRTEVSPNHASRRQPTQLWTSLDAEQASADFSHRAVYVFLALGSLVPAIWAFVAAF